MSQSSSPGESVLDSELRRASFSAPNAIARFGRSLSARGYQSWMGLRFRRRSHSRPGAAPERSRVRPIVRSDLGPLGGDQSRSFAGITARVRRHIAFARARAAGDRLRRPQGGGTGPGFRVRVSQISPRCLALPDAGPSGRLDGVESARLNYAMRRWEIATS